MPNYNQPPGLFGKDPLNGLRTGAPPSKVKVFKLEYDSKGNPIKGKEITNHKRRNGK